MTSLRCACQLVVVAQPANAVQPRGRLSPRLASLFRHRTRVGDMIPVAKVWRTGASGSASTGTRRHGRCRPRGLWRASRPQASTELFDAVLRRHMNAESRQCRTRQLAVLLLHRHSGSASALLVAW